MGPAYIVAQFMVKLISVLINFTYTTNNHKNRTTSDPPKQHQNKGPETVAFRQALKPPANDNKICSKEPHRPLWYGIWYEIYQERNRLESALSDRYSTNLANIPIQVKNI